MPRTTTSKKSPAKAKTTGSTKTSPKDSKKTSAAKGKPTARKSAQPTKAAPTSDKAKAKARKPRTSSSKKAALTLKKNVEPHALDDDVTEKVRQLIHLSREQGFLTYKDVDSALPEISEKPEELQNVISIFNNLEIKLLDSKEVDKFKKKKEESEEESARSSQSDMLDDPVRMYLKQMGQVPLLSREEEVEISKRN